MHTPYEIDYDMSKENAERVARKVEQFRARPKSKDTAEKPGVLLKTRLAVASALALFFGG